MPVCKTCTNGTTCSSCDSFKGLVLNSANVCACVSPNLLNPATLTCSSCSSFYSNCLTCGYNSSYTPSSPSPVICTQPATGYYISGNGTAACGAYCLSCTSSIQCNPNECYATFNNQGGICGCTGTDFASNDIPPVCEACSLVFPGCSSCQTSGTTTSCTLCSDPYYLISSKC
jgi:hypothetical protein